ncbi:MAG: amino acid ABC transporter substrate-binding protein [Hyphomonadaceae bacterium]|nr:amino acid ABC transporter substrate-binding protein [Clostridia bacterium]
MKLGKKLLLVMLVLVAFTSLVLGGCATTSTKVLKVGVDDVYPPMEYKENGKDSIGFDIDLAKEIAKRMDAKLELVSTSWSGIFTALNADKFDCIISSVSINEERLAAYAMTKPYIANAQVIVVPPANTTIKEPRDLNGKTVGAQTETTASESCDDFIKKGVAKFELKKYDQVIQPFADMKTGRLDAIVVDEVVARYYANKSANDFKVVGGKLTNEPIGICLKKGNDQKLAEMQKVLDSIRADGTLKKISMTWFGADLVSDVPQK